jgi:hypothetical protein
MLFHCAKQNLKHNQNRSSATSSRNTYPVTLDMHCLMLDERPRNGKTGETGILSLEELVANIINVIS